jgi:L-alanine-DL-glutamate epimerase-like enolase superfamily enzyme
MRGVLVKIEAVDFFYLSMPEILDIGDGSQDLLLVRVRAGEHTGWGECEASPLVSIASFVTPMSHSACKPVRDSVLGQHIDSVDDIRRIGDLVRANSLDLLQADHTLSGVDMALWDLLGKVHKVPVHELLGTRVAYPKRPYASQLFGDTPAETFRLAQQVRSEGYTAAKFGWGPFGLGDAASDTQQIMAAREGLGPDAALMVDVGTVWIDDVARATERLDVLKQCDVIWLEEPFVSGAFDAYRAFSDLARPIALAAGEGCHNAWQARHLIDYAGVGFIQIDAGRIGGITQAAEVARYARQRGVAYVNHTFTSHLALSASLQPFAGIVDDEICEYPVAPKSLAIDLTREHLRRDPNGMIHVPDRPGLGVSIDVDAVRPYLVDVEIRVDGQTLYQTPELTDS